MPLRFALVLFCFLAVAPAFGQEQRSTREMEALSPREADRVVRRDLLSILQPLTEKIRSGMRIELRGAGFSTLPVGTEFENVCRRDAVTLWYASDNPIHGSRDAPVKPYSITAAPLFRIVGVPKPQARGKVSNSGIWQAACHSLDTDTGWFTAVDAFHALQGALVYQKALDSVRAGRIKVEPCGETFSEGSTCEQIVLTAGGLGNVDTIATCPTQAGQICYVIDLGSSTKITVKARGTDPTVNEDGAADVAPGDVLTVAVEQYIVVT